MKLERLFKLLFTFLALPTFTFALKGGSRRGRDDRPKTMAETRALKGNMSSKKSKTKIDTMVVYTPAAMCAQAGQPVNCEATKSNRKAIEDEAKLNIRLTNDALKNSGAKVEFKLVHMALDEFIYEAGVQDSTGALLSLMDSNTAVRDLRNQHGADVVVQIFDDIEWDPDGGNGVAGTTFYKGNNNGSYCRKGEERPGEVITDLTPEEQAEVDGQFKGYCDQNAYVLVNRHGRSNFVMSHELGHTLDLEDSDREGSSKKSFCSTLAESDEGCFKTMMISQQDGSCDCLDGEGGVVADTTEVLRTLIFNEPQVPYLENAAKYVSKFR